MEVTTEQEQALLSNVVNPTSMMNSIGNQLRNMPIPSPPSLSSSCEDDSDDISDEDEDSMSLQCLDHTNNLTTRLLLAGEDINHDLSNLTLVGPETQARLEALLEAAGVAADGKAFTDPEVLRRLTSSVSSALDEAAAALTRMRSQTGKPNATTSQSEQGTRSLVEACIEGDIAAVRKLLDEGRSVHEPTDEGESLLSLACSAGYYELVQVLLAMNANVEDRGSKGDCTPLIEAASNGFVDIVKLLLQHGANVNAQSSAGNTSLHKACGSGYDDVVELLIQHNADLEHQNENGHTPLMDAASNGHVKVAKLLLDAGAGINTHSSEFKESALTLACYKGHVDMVFFLLERGADQEHKTDEMHTALMEASMDGHVEVARLLLDHGAQVNMPADSFESPLTLAACGSHVELAELLIEHGANLEEVNDEGFTPLMEAAREGYLPMVALLLAHGANLYAQTEETQETALTLACCGGFLEVVAYLLDCGADIELGASTPLMEAATEGHVELVKFLIEKGANVNAITATGDAALTYAAENGHTDVVEVLIEQGANIEHESEGGRTPLMKAARAGHLCTVEYLLSQGADVNRKTSGGEHSVLSLACAGGHTAVVELLLGRGGNPTMKLKDNSSMLIEAAKGGHANVAHLLMNTQIHQQTFTQTDTLHSEYPIHSSALPTDSAFPICPHVQHEQDHIAHQPDCHFHNTPENQHFAHDFSQQIIQPSSPSDHFQQQHPNDELDDENYNNNIDVNTSPTDLYLPNIPVSLASSLSLANLTTADLQHLAQVLQYSSNQNQTLEDVVAAGQNAEQIGLQTITFPAIDPQVESFTTQSEVCTPSPSNTATALVTSAGRTITSTGVQTEDAISMIQKLTNSVHQLNALQTFAASHNLELVNLGEITLPPAPFQLETEAEEGIMVADSARTLQNSINGMVREDPIGECSSLPSIETTLPVPAQSPVTPPLSPAIDIDQSTDSNHDTALTIACAGGHDELVQLLLARGSNIEHRDKKGCTPLILAATAGHTATCHILLEHGADIEAQSDRTKDTALSLACSSGRQEVVELLLMSNANFEHRNVSDYTPLSLAASGGYVGIIKVLLNHGAEINSRTGSKLGISPLMLAAMNGHVAAVKLLLDRGSDVNAQIETNRNTALTLACFQGRTEVVGLLLDRHANVEHRAKTGLTPLMEAASGGYVDVGRVLIDRGADVNAIPVPSSRDTALTIAADKGHYKFAELLVVRGAVVDVRNKKGCTPLWLSAHGGHLDVCQLLAREGADVNAMDNRAVSVLVAAFRKGNIKVVKWLVKHVSQFPPDSDCKRFIQTISDKDLLKKLDECMQIINAAKKRQEAEANKNASILLEELDHEKKKEERRKAQAQKKRDKKKQKKKKKSTEKQSVDTEEDGEKEDEEEFEHATSGFPFINADQRTPLMINDERPDLSTAELKLKSQVQLKSKKKSRLKSRNSSLSKSTDEEKEMADKDVEDIIDPVSTAIDALTNIVITTAAQFVSSIKPTDTVSAATVAEITKALAASIITNAKDNTKTSIPDEVVVTMATAAAQRVAVSISSPSLLSNNNNNGFALNTSQKKAKRVDDEWKEVTRSIPHTKSRKILIPAALISRVIGRGGCNVNAIREHTGAHIDIDTNRKKANGDCMVTIKGSQQATKQAGNLIQSLIDDPDSNVAEILPTLPTIATSLSTSVSSSSLIPLMKSLTKPTTIESSLDIPKTIQSLSKSLNTPKTNDKVPTLRQISAPANLVPPTSTPSSQPVRMVPVVNSNSKKLEVAKESSAPSRTKVKPPALTTTTPNSGWKSTNQQDTNTVLKQTSSTMAVSTHSQVSVTRQLSNEGSQVHQQIITTISTTVFSSSSRNLPKPIGSNRPFRPIASPTNALSSTAVSNSVAATLHSTLNSLLSQVATQRSPMIWNDHPGSKEHHGSSGDLVVTTVATSPNNTLNGTPIERFLPASLSQASSQESFKGHSRTPSLSPTSNHSNSPTPEEKPHLNPIGSERGHKKPTVNQQGGLQGLTSLLQGSDSGQNLWRFDYNMRKSPSWKPNSSPVGWTAPNEQAKEMKPLLANGDMEHHHPSVDHVIGPDETLQSLLERLSLSTHLNLFQKNEIDLDALMLMSEQDYADIGLPKEPRIKLLNSMRQLQNRSTAHVPQSPPQQIPLLKHINPQPLWNSAMDNNLHHPESRLPPALRNSVHFPGTPQLAASWQTWSNTIDQ
ncbi:ankyrin repeat domain-containing protein 17-like [Clytia hemisphaerica]|uniref:Uncharacterized protein n=1 Tax=Clytia hemisphaerica TaxID=252671 RepID=A0A7M5VAM6_9CNID